MTTLFLVSLGVLVLGVGAFAVLVLIGGAMLRETDVDESASHETPYLVKGIKR